MNWSCPAAPAAPQIPVDPTQPTYKDDPPKRTWQIQPKFSAAKWGLRASAAGSSLGFLVARFIQHQPWHEIGVNAIWAISLAMLFFSIAWLADRIPSET